MKLLKLYLKNLNEQRSINKKPSPTFAWELVYGKPMKGWRQGRYPFEHETKLWNGIEIDIHLNEKWLNELNSIREIEMRASCEGHSKDWVSFIAFRFKNKNKSKKYLNLFVDKMNMYDYTFCVKSFHR